MLGVTYFNMTADGNALKPIWKGRIVRGGSTITQQLVKNLYLSTSRDPIRKGKELIINVDVGINVEQKTNSRIVPEYH